MTSVNKTNEYSAGIRRLPEEILREYVEKPDNFHEDAVLAAIWELGNRRKLNDDEIRLEKELSLKLIPVTVEPMTGISQEYKIAGSALPSLYSVRAIQLFSVLFSVIAGGILMAINFNRTTQKSEAIKVILFSIVYTIVSVLIINSLGTQSPILSVVMNFIGALLIEQFFWKRVFGSEFRYNKQQIWGAMLVAIILISPLAWYAYKSGAFAGL